MTAVPKTSKQPMTRWRRSRWLVGAASLLGVVLAVLLGALLWYLRTDDFQRQATRAIEAAVEAQTCEQVTLGAVHVGLFPPVVEIERLHVWDEASDETILSADSIRVPIVARRGIGIGQLALARPFVQVHVGEEGLVEFAGCGKPGDGGGEPLTEIPWSSLLVTDGTIRVVLPDGEIEISKLALTPVEGPITDIDGRLYVRLGALEQAAPIDLDNVTIGPDRIGVPRLQLDTDLLRLEGRGEWPLGGEIDARAKGSARLDELQPLFEPPGTAYGQVEFDAGISGPTSDPRVEIALLGTDIGIDKPSIVPGVVVMHRFGNVSASLEAGKDGVDIEKAVLQWGEGRVLAWGHVTTKGEIEDGHVLAEDLSLGHVLRQLDAFRNPWVDMQGDAELTVSGTVSPLHLQGDMDFGLADLRVTDRPYDAEGRVEMLHIPVGTVHGKFDITSEEAVLDADYVRGGDTSGRVVARIPVAAGNQLDIRADLDRADLTDLRPLGASDLHGRGRLTAHIWGDPRKGLQAAGHASVDGFAVTGLPYADHLETDIRSPDMRTLVFEGAQGLKGDTRYGGNLTLDFRDPMSMELDIVIGDGRVEDVVGVFVDLPGLTGRMDGTLTLDGPMNDMDGEVHISLADVSLWGERFVGGEGHGHMDQGVFTLQELRLFRGDGHEGVSLRGSVEREWALDMELVGDGLALERMDWLAPAEQPLSGRLAFVSRVDGTLFEPQPHGRIAVTDVRYAGRPVADSVVRFGTKGGVTTYRGALIGGTVDVNGTLGLWNEQPYALTARLDRFPAHMLYPVGADGQPIEAVVTGDVGLKGHFGDDPSPVDIVADASDVRLGWSGQELRNEGAWHYEQHGVGFRLDDFGLAGGSTRLVLSAAGGDVPLDVEGTGTVDLDLLRMVVPGLTRAQGTAEVTVTATGRAPDVEALVQVEIDGAPLVRHSGFPGTFEEVSAVLRGGRDGYTIVSATAELGGGEAVAWGRILAEDWIPVRYDLGAEITGAQVQWVDWLPPAIGHAEVKFDGPPDALLLSGHVDIDEMTFSDRIDWEDWVVEWRDELLVDSGPTDEPPLFSLDVELHGDSTIRLRNNLAEGLASADLRVIGDTARPGLVGTVEVDEGVAYLQDREFVIARGEAAFRDPWSWDPDLDFELVTDIQSRERQYRVTYLILGPFSDWRTETRSDPALPQADVNALLWFGVTAEELEELGELEEAIGQGVADLILADFFVANQTAQDLQGELPQLLDRIDLVTGVNARGEYSSDPRLLVAKGFGPVDVTAEIDLVGNPDQFVRMETPISDAWSLAGWYASVQRDRNLPIGGAWGVDLRARWEAD
jgi:hypothetical protein